MSEIIALFLFFGTLAGYSILSLPPKIKFADTFRSTPVALRSQLLLLLFSATSAALLFPFLPGNGQQWSMIGACLTLAYGFPMPPDGRPLRNLPFLKIFLIALTWTTAIVILPWSARSEEVVPFPWLLFWGKLCFIFALTLPFDLRDMQTDRQAGILTLPIALRWPACQGIGLTALTAGAFLVAIPLLGQDRLAVLLTEAIAFLLAGFGLLLIKPHHHNLLFSLGLDGLLLLPALLGWFIR